MYRLENIVSRYIVVSVRQKGPYLVASINEYNSHEVKLFK